MTIRPRRMLSLAAALLLTAAGAQAQGHGHDKEKDKDKGHERSARELQQPERMIERDAYDNGRRLPPGLAKKPGGMPPGQYKKHYSAQQGSGVLRDIFINRGYTVVRTQSAGESQYVYYRLRDGSVRRAIVSPGSDQLAFSNVPAALLREVLSRLY